MPHILQNKSNKTETGRGGDPVCCPLVDEYFEVAFGGGTGPAENESEYNSTQTHSRIQTRLRRKPGERDAGRA